MESLLKFFNNCDHPKKWVLWLKNIIIWHSKGFQAIKTGTEYFLTKRFCGNFVEVLQQSLPFRKMSFITLKYHFLAQKSSSDNKNKDKIIFYKYFLTG